MTDDTARLRARIAELESRHLTVHRPTIERIKRAHTAMPLSAWASDETAQHRTYCQGQDEQCYLCALIIEVEAAQARIAALEGALRDCVDAMHEDNPASGWKEIIDNGRAALSGSQSADPRDAVVEAALWRKEVQKHLEKAAREGVSSKVMRAHQNRVDLANKEIDDALSRLAPTKGDW